MLTLTHCEFSALDIMYLSSLVDKLSSGHRKADNARVHNSGVPCCGCSGHRFSITLDRSLRHSRTQGVPSDI